MRDSSQRSTHAPYVDAMNCFHVLLQAIVDAGNAAYKLEFQAEHGPDWETDPTPMRDLDELGAAQDTAVSRVRAALTAAKAALDSLPSRPQAECKLDGDIYAASHAHALLMIGNWLCRCSVDATLAEHIRPFLTQRTITEIRKALPTELDDPAVTPWIKRADFVDLLVTNNILKPGQADKVAARKEANQTVWRWKDKLGAEGMLGTNNRTFRFRLSALRNANLIYPVAWEASHTSGN